MIPDHAGKDFIAMLYAVVRAVQIYDIKNDVVTVAAQKFIGFLRAILSHSTSVEVVRYRDYLFFNKQRLRFEIDGYATLLFIDERLKALRIKSLAMDGSLTETELLRFAVAFNQDRASFVQESIAEKYQAIRIQFATPDDEVPDFLRDSRQARKTYYKALKVTKSLIGGLWQKKPVDARNFRRVVYTLIDSLSIDEFGLTALAAIKNYDEYTYNHSLNVGVIALAMGQRLNLSKRELVKLGTAALLHDIGKVDLDKELLYKATKLTDDEWHRVQRHALYGVKEIIKTRGLDDIATSAIISTYQHHINYDGTGYPKSDYDTERPLIFSRIIRICDAYDAMTTPRPYQLLPYPPPIAVRVLWARRGVFFDPLLVKVFVQLLGLYPVGSCLEFADGDVALVLQQNPTDMGRPVVRIIVHDGTPIDGDIVDLSISPEPRIVRITYAEKHGVNPQYYLR